jgi:hypothetical protein
MKERYYFLFGTIFYLTTIQEVKAQNISRDSIKFLIHSCINYIEKEQIETTITGIQFKGEWPTYMCLQKSYPLLGKPKNHYDSNCFSITSIYNMLAETYFMHPEFEEIPKILNNAFPQILSYLSKDGGFNFWPLHPPNGRLRQFGKNNKAELVRGPIQYRMLMPYIRKAANVMNDNDDSAQGWLSIIYYQKLNNIQNSVQASDFFEKYRDTLRENQHYYNLCYGNCLNTGAYMTWRGNEATFPGWNIPRVLINNALFLFPVSTAYPHAYKPYMPYGANDVDAIVNANILSTLGVNNSLNKTAGSKEAAKFISLKVKRKSWNTAGIYYPNKYHLHYAVLRAKSKGALYLDEAAEEIEKHLLNSQLKNGSFKSRIRVNKKDVIQSTAYALNALLKIGNPFGTNRENAIHKALHYLLSNCHNSKEDICWEGGVFFSGGTVIRNILVWKSDVYTTALIMDSLSMYLTYLN